MALRANSTWTVTLGPCGGREVKGQGKSHERHGKEAQLKNVIKQNKKHNGCFGLEAELLGSSGFFRGRWWKDIWQEPQTPGDQHPEDGSHESR